MTSEEVGEVKVNVVPPTLRGDLVTLRPIDPAFDATQWFREMQEEDMHRLVEARLRHFAKRDKRFCERHYVITKETWLEKRANLSTTL